MTGTASPVRAVVVMGVSGAGKSVVGAGLAARLGWDFIDADHLHPASNVEKMAGGIPLTDDDRWPWLDVVGATLMGHPDGVVMACSALRRVYRDRIRAAAPSTFFVELDGTPELLLSRISARVGHFMPPSLLSSQLATLESLGADELGARVSIDGTPEEVVEWAAAPSTFFVELDGTPELLLSRISARVGHFMPPSLLSSQLATLESLGADELGARVSIDGTPEEVVEWAASAVSG